MATIVKKQPGQTEDQLIAQFRKKVLNEEIIDEIRKREFYQKPSRARYEREKALKKRKPRRTY
ncbi:MAG: 30S ribosomal protein S21 [bacterium]|nr:30S ribosomal protein S21 [bacterium]MDZ4209804.1 30S ribosomal protein S21 [Candidatus Curtissbacteria bacterium]